MENVPQLLSSLEYEEIIEAVTEIGFKVCLYYTDWVLDFDCIDATYLVHLILCCLNKKEYST